MQDAIVIEPHGVSWAVRHNGGFLGFTSSRAEAVIIAQDLVEWIESQGRPASLIIQARARPEPRTPSVRDT